MKIKRLLGIIGASILGLGAIANIASADTHMMHKWTDPGTQKTYLYFPLNDGSPVEYLIVQRLKQRTLTLNNCGIGKIKKTPIAPHTYATVGYVETINFPPIENIEGNGVNFAGKTTGADPTCTLDKTTGTYTSSWVATVGSVLESDNYYHIKGGEGAGSIALNVTVNAKVSPKPNACGWLRVGNPPEKFSMQNNGMINLSSVNAVTAPVHCSKTGVLYHPQ